MFHIVFVSPLPENKLAILKKDQIKSHVPTNNGQGAWTSVAIKYSLFSDSFFYSDIEDIDSIDYGYWMKDFENCLPLNISDEIVNGEIFVNEDKGKLAIVVDYEEEDGVSQSGKTILISSSRKAKKIETLDGRKIYLSFNLYKYPEY